MALRWLIRSLMVLVASLAILFAYDRLWLMSWVGTTDLNIEFDVIDAGTRRPVPGARVEIRRHGEAYYEGYRQAFTLVADAGGTARKSCPGVMCYGLQSGLRFKDTFSVSLPDWYFRVIAEGFESSAWENLYAPTTDPRARLVGPGKSMLTVPVLLRKRAA